MKKLVLTLMICSFFAATSVFGQNNPTTLNNQNGAIYTMTAQQSGVFDFDFTVPFLGSSLNGTAYSIGRFGSNYHVSVDFQAQTEFNNVSTFNSNVNFNSLSTFNGNVTHNGNVGIGTATPNGKLHVANGNIFLSNGDLFVATGNATIAQGDLTITNGRIVLVDGIKNELALYNDGRIHAREVEVNLDVIPDYVFKDDYDLMPLSELRTFINQNHHLPNIKSEAEYKAYGRIPLKELNLKLLEKVEELTLYTLEQEAKIEALEAANIEIESLKKQMAEMQKMIQTLSENDK